MKQIAVLLTALLASLVIMSGLWGCGSSQKVSAPVAEAPPAYNWPGFRGENGDNVAAVGNTFQPDAQYNLKNAWKVQLGSGYSGIAVVGNRAVTMFSDSTFDYMGAYDTRTGRELWRFKIDSTYKGHDGSHDGPISTPYIAGDKVYGVAPRGQFFALKLTDGMPVWQKHLVKEFEARKPWYGFSTSPLVTGEVVFLEMGGVADNNALVGFHKDTGELLWSTGQDTIAYQSPMLVTIDGQPQIMAAAKKYLYSIEPATGEVLWKIDYQGDGRPFSSGGMTPILVGNDRLFLTYKGNESKMIHLSRTEDKLEPQTLWANNTFRRSYTIPVYYQGHLYGITSGFLTCVDAETGELRWKSRRPGDGFPMILDGHLVIVTKKGTLHVAKASPEGYQQIAENKTFANHSWSSASFANGSLFVRTFGELARVDIVKRSAAPAAPAIASGKKASPFMMFLHSLEKAPDKAAAIDKFIASQKSFPIIEGDRQVWFVYRGEGEDVALVGDLIGDRREEPMTRVAGTDLFYYPANLEPDAFQSYRYVVDYEKVVADTLNSRRTPSVFGEMSWFAMPQWQKPQYLSGDAPRSGQLDSVSFTSKITEADRRLDVYLPPGYNNGDDRYPVAYIHQGGLAVNWGEMPKMLDHMSGKAFGKVIVVFVHNKPNTRSREFSGDLKNGYAQMLAEEIVPYIDANYRTDARPQARASIGMGFSGYMAFYAALKHPGVFGKVGSQSAFMISYGEVELQEISKTAAEQPLDIYLEWSKYDYRAVHEQWGANLACKNLANFYKSRGYKPLTSEVNNGFGWASWKSRTDRMFAALFPI